jgi:hypothetical protein
LAYLPNFDEDVFISYAHNDDDVYAQEPWGWVTRLHQDLEQRVRNYLGSDIRFWRDCEIRNNEDFSNKIFRRLARTATLLSVLSPSFLQREWCRRELDAFTGNAESQAQECSFLRLPAHVGRCLSYPRRIEAFSLLPSGHVRGCRLVSPRRIWTTVRTREDGGQS